MLPAPHTVDEDERIKLLHALRLLESPAEATFDQVVRLAARTLGTPMAMITLVGRERLMIKARVGLDMTDMPRDLSFCCHAILDSRPLLVPDTLQDVRFADNPLVTGSPGIRAYAGVPIVSNGGTALGTLCVLDREPRELSAEEVTALQDLAALISREIGHRELAQRSLTTFHHRRRLDGGHGEAAMEADPQGTVDGLTGLPNRRALLQRLPESMTRADRAGYPAGVLLLDVDDFNAFNERHGQESGDRLLQVFAARLRRAVRGSDMVARLGDDQFVIVFELLKNGQPDAEKLAQKMTDLMAEPFALDGEQRPVGISVGFYLYEPHAVITAEQALAAADRARQEAKRGGRNHVRLAWAG